MYSIHMRFEPLITSHASYVYYKQEQAEYKKLMLLKTFLMLTVVEIIQT